MVEKSDNTNIRVKVKNVRASYPHYFKKHAYEENEPKYSGGFIIDPSTKTGAVNCDNIEAAVKKVAMAAGITKVKRCCFNEGNDEYPEQEGMMYLSASNKNRPTVVDRDRTPLTAEDGKPYGGCYVDAIVTIYAMPKHKGVFATLEGVQFVKDGESFGAPPLSEDEFDDYGDEEDEEDEKPRSKKRRPADDDDEEDEKPRSKKRRPADDDDEEDEKPRNKKRRPADDDEEEAPRSRSKRRARSDDDDEEDDGI